MYGKKDYLSFENETPLTKEAKRRSNCAIKGLQKAFDIHLLCNGLKHWAKQ